MIERWRKLVVAAAIGAWLCSSVIAVLWYRSYTAFDVWNLTTREGWRYTIRSLDGVLEWTETPTKDATAATKERDMRFIEIRHSTVLAPLVLGALACSIAYARTMIGRRRAATRLRLGQCWKCGYDLRASDEICPECGVAKSAQVLQ